MILGGASGPAQIDSNTAYRFHGPFYSHSDSSINDVEQVLPIGGTLSQLNVALHDDASNADGEAWTFVLMVNGADPDPITPTGATDLLCTITGDGVETCSDTVNEVSVVAGDKIALMSVPSCKNPRVWGPGSSECPPRRQMRWTVLLVPNPK